MQKVALKRVIFNKKCLFLYILYIYDVKKVVKFYEITT